MIWTLAGCGNGNDDHRSDNFALIDICVKYDGPGEIKTHCAEVKQLRIPTLYFDPHVTVDKEIKKESQWLYAAYPSMRPWESLSSEERHLSHKVEIRIDGFTLQTVQESFRINFYQNPKPVHVSEPLFGLDRFDDVGYRMYLLPLEHEPKLHISCSKIGVADDPDKGTCRVTTYNEWKLKAVYAYPQILLPEWRDIQIKILNLLQSFVVTSSTNN